MTHYQAGTPGMEAAIAAMPDGSSFKTVSDAGLLSHIQRTWVAAGRDPKRLRLCYRHGDLYLPKGDWASLKAQWRAMFFRFVNRTYLENQAPWVTEVEENNEYYTNASMAGWEKPLYLASVRAAVAVWNEEFRGKRVTAPDGGVGTIRADCRLVLGNPPVTHGLPREYFQLALESDNALGYHPYTKYVGGVRVPDDWAAHSGYWHTLEGEYGLKPLWVFSECGPYFNTDDGWRAPTCLNGDPEALYSAMTRWWRQVAATDAYREGRLLGPAGHWFTSGHIGWDFYQLDGPELLRLAHLARTFFSWKEPPVDTHIEARLRGHLTAALDLLDAQFLVKVVTPVLNVRAGAGTSFADVGDVHEGDELPVFEQLGTWYRIDPREARWVSALPAYTQRLV